MMEVGDKNTWFTECLRLKVYEKKVIFNEGKYYILVLILFYIGLIIDSTKAISSSVNLYLV